MNANTHRGEGESLPDHLAAEAGLPRASGLGHDFGHDAGNGATLAETRSTEAIEQTAETHAREAANAASDLKERASDAAGAARERVRDTVDDLRDRASDAYEDARDWASDRYDESRRLADHGYRRLRRGRSATEAFVADNPLLVGVVGLAAGLLLGALLPRTEREDEALGPFADEAREQGLRYAREATRHGRAFVERALDPDNLDAAVREATGEDRYAGEERTAHRL